MVRQIPAYETRRWTGRKHDHCVVVPVFNEAHRIAALLRRMSTTGTHDLADVIVVDGASTDGSLGPGVVEFSDVAGILVKRGPGGLSSQLRCAYSFALDAGYEGIVTIDGNNKDDPAAIPDFISALRSGADFVQASRFVAGGVSVNTPVLRSLAIRLVHAPTLSIASRHKWTDTTQGFRGYSAAVLRDPRVAPFRDVFVRYELLAYLSYRVPRLGYRCVEIPTRRAYPPDEVPTKIRGVRGNVELLRVLFAACFGRLNP